MPVIVEIAVDVIGTCSTSVGDLIRVAVDVIKKSGYKYEIAQWVPRWNYRVLRRWVGYCRRFMTSFIRLG